MTKIKVAVGLSGGVDSAVSAYLLKKRGFDVSGVYLHCFDDDAPDCRGKQDRQDALKVAVHLKIPFQVLDFRRQYKSSVIGYFKKEYLAGRTPNPDVVCNRDIKFGLFLDWVIKQGFDYVATGHYARLVPLADSRNSRTTAKYANPLAFAIFAKFRDFREMRLDTSSKLKRTPDDVILTQPRDLHKDQTYFLWAVPREKFCRVLFPLANFTKKDVRSAAKFAKIPVADKPDSTGICFIGEVRVEDFLKRLGVKEKAGEVVTRVCGEYPENGYTAETVKTAKISNRSAVQPFSRSDRLPPQSHRHTDSCYCIIGSHRGVWFYTIGQRHGFSTDLWSSKNKAKGQRPKAKGDGGTDSLSPYPLSLSPDSDRLPLYVIAKDVRRNRLIVGFGPETYRDNFEVSDCNWLVSDFGFRLPAGEAGISDFPHVSVRIRHLGDLIPCRLEPITNEQMNIFLSIPQRGIAPGQSAVFYSKEGIVIGGGVIQ